MRLYIVEIYFRAYAKEHSEFIKVQKALPLEYSEAREIAQARVREICYTGILDKITVHQIQNSLTVSVDEQTKA